MCFYRTKRILAVLLAILLFLPLLLINSYAGLWQTEDGFYGDLVKDNQINASDALLCLQGSVKLITLTEEQIVIADVNVDHVVNASDALMILQMSVNLIQRFPAYEISREEKPPVSSEEPPVPSEEPPVSSEEPPVSSEEPPVPSTDTFELEDFGYRAIDSSEYYCYSQLNQIQRQIYQTIHLNATNMTKGKFKVGRTQEVEQSDVRIAFLAYINDHPEVFWLSKGYLYSTDAESVYVYFSDSENQLDYLYSKNDCDRMKKELQAMVLEAFRKSLLPGLTPVERELRLHDWLAEHCEYNDAAAAAVNSNAYPEAFTSYGALVTGEAVCEGYSRAFQLLCYYAGIECTLVTGTSKDSSHMWNAVKLENWYLVDVTWNSDPKPMHHTFLNQTTEHFSLTHDFYKSWKDMTKEELLSAVGFNFILPSFTTTTYEYHYMYGVVTTLKTASQGFAAEVAERINSGANTVEIMVEDAVFNTIQDASAFIEAHIQNIVDLLDDDRFPRQYSYSITPGANCLVLTFIY